MLWVLKRTISFEHPQHMLELIGKKIFAILQCELCGDVFKDRSKLQNHMTKHTGRHSHRHLVKSV